MLVIKCPGRWSKYRSVLANSGSNSINCFVRCLDTQVERACVLRIGSLWRPEGHKMCAIQIVHCKWRRQTLMVRGPSDGELLIFTLTCSWSSRAESSSAGHEDAPASKTYPVHSRRSPFLPGQPISKFETRTLANSKAPLVSHYRAVLQRELETLY